MNQSSESIDTIEAKEVVESGEESDDWEDCENLRAFGSEDVSYIGLSDMDKIIDSVKSYNDACSTPSLLVRLIHFHEDHPENHNLKLENDMAHIYNGTEWEIKDKRESINILVDKAFSMIVSYYNRRKKLYREKNKIICKQKELYERYPELKDEIHKELKIIENAPIVIEPILSANMSDELDLSDSIFGLYSNDFLQEYFAARKLEIELIKSGEKGEELVNVRKKISDLDQQEEEIIYSSSEDRTSEGSTLEAGEVEKGEQQINSDS